MIAPSTASPPCADCASPTLWGETPYCEECAAARRAALTSVEVLRPEHHWRCRGCGSRVVHAVVTTCWNCQQNRAPSSVARKPAGDFCPGCGYHWYAHRVHSSDCTGPGRECACGAELLTTVSRHRGRCVECHFVYVNSSAPDTE